MKKFTKKASIQEIINGKHCPLPINIIPNNMGINLVSVKSVEWVELEDGQIETLTINFIPEIKKENE